MKTSKLILILTAIFLAGGMIGCKTSEESQIKKDLNSKPIKLARKEAKQLKKEGYYVSPGALPMEKQLENAYIKQSELDDKGFPKYLVAEIQSVGETQAAAKIQATEIAKLDIAGQVSSNIAALIENSIANQQLNTEDAASVTKTVVASKNLIAQELGRVLPLLILYKDISKNIEANVRLAYSYDMAMEAGKKVIRKSLEEQTDILHEKLDKLMEF